MGCELTDVLKCWGIGVCWFSEFLRGVRVLVVESPPFRGFSAGCSCVLRVAGVLTDGCLWWW